jgi:hypothetical protein
MMMKCGCPMNKIIISYRYLYDTIYPISHLEGQKFFIEYHDDIKEEERRRQRNNAFIHIDDVVNKQAASLCVAQSGTAASCDWNS